MSQLAGFVLGNAYLALFFSQMETTDHIKKALVAYRQAETDKTEATNNPDLHHNSATVYECVALTLFPPFCPRDLVFFLVHKVCAMSVCWQA